MSTTAYAFLIALFAVTLVAHDMGWLSPSRFFAGVWASTAAVWLLIAVGGLIA